MFWKFVNRLRPRHWSLVSKLMLLYTVSTICILAAASLFLYPTFLRLVEADKSGTAHFYCPNKKHCNVASERHSFVSHCYRQIIIVLLLSVLCATILGYSIARNAIGRIHEFSKKLENISGSSLHERIDPQDWPKELKILAKRFNTMLDRLQHSFIQLSQFSSDIAHELRNPVNNLLGMTEIALTNNKSVVEYQQTLESMIDEYQHLSKLIENLLFLARSDHGQLAINKSPQDARPIILKMFDYFEAIAAEKNIEMYCEGEATILIEPTLFKRAVSNLISNALRYTPANGKIHVDLLRLKNKGARIVIRDTGVGIAKEHLQHVFDRFYRIDISRSSLSGGLGLGLAIVKAIIQLHGGTITIDSEVNVGTLVYLDMPND